MKRKICVVVTARASYAKIKSLLVSLKTHENVDLQIICAASAVVERFGNITESIINDGFVVNEILNFLIEGEDLHSNTKSTGLGIIDFANAFLRLKPDVVVVMADRFEVMAPAIAASYQNIPLAHIQGGEVSGNIDEKVRHSITKLADIHFPATSRAMDWLIKMGENQNMVFLAGCPSIDLVLEILKAPELDFDIYQKYGGVGDKPDLTKGYYIVMQHPVTSEQEETLEHTKETLDAIVELKKPVLWFWPNADAGSNLVSKVIRKYREDSKLEHIHFIKNMEPIDFLRVLNKSIGIIGNSSAAIREASFMGVPAVNIGKRQSNRERGENVIDVNPVKKDILDAIEKHLVGRKKKSIIYGSGDAGLRIADVLSDVTLTYVKKLNYLNIKT